MARIETQRGTRLVHRRVWERTTTGFVAWVIQRVTAVLLLVLVPLKIWSGWVLVGKVEGGAALARSHVSPGLDGLLLFAVIFHVLYGVRVMLIEAGLHRWADPLFTVLTVLGVIALGVGLYVIF